MKPGSDTGPRISPRGLPMSEPSYSALPTSAWRPDGDDFPRLFDRYQILGVLGEGGMGTVFKGYHLNLKRFVAIKTLRLDRTLRPDLVNRFLREMEAVGQMDHPNVVRATDAGEKNGVFYLVMDYLEGMDLGRLTARRGRLEVADACELARQAALGLDYIHRTLVHRDVKPSNLVLTPAGLVKILDLGVARLREARAAGGEQTPEGCAVGTYDYMAPEQAATGVPVDGRADVYGLGCTLFKLLTGRAPFSGPEFDSAAKKLFAHGHVPLSAAEGYGSIPPGLGAVLLRMTAKDPAARHATAAEAARALEPFAAGSRPARLLETDGGGPPLQPLPRELPVELSRLTDIPNETPPTTPKVLALADPVRPAGRRRLLLGAALLAAVLVALAALFGPGLLDRPGSDVPSARDGGTPRRPGPATGLRQLDDLRPYTYHNLLDRAPVPVGCDPGDRQWYRWEEDEQRVDVQGLGTLVLLLGTTSRSHFEFSVRVREAPWMGNVGLVWGYQEDPAVKKSKAPRQKFARFQALCLWQELGPKRDYRYSARRARGSLAFNDRGDVVSDLAFLAREDVPLLGGEVIAEILIERNRLSRALLNQRDLKNLCSEPVAGYFRSDPYRGAIGVISVSQAGSLTNARFMARSTK